MADCVFCKIDAKQIPATVVHEDEHTLAFMDIGQVNPGHVLVAVKKALALAEELEGALRGKDYRKFLKNMYGSKPDEWSDALESWDRLRVIVNVMTRMRFCTSRGRMDFKSKGKTPPAGYVPWYELRKDKEAIVCGHWSAQGLKLTQKMAALDSGCVWGGTLSAMRLEDRALFQVPCAGYQEAGGE